MIALRNGGEAVAAVYRGADVLWQWQPPMAFVVGLGLLLDPSRLDLMSQDAAGTVPVTGPGQPVGLIRDQSGGGHHVTQSVAGSRPTLARHPATGRRNVLTRTNCDFVPLNTPLTTTVTDASGLQLTTAAIAGSGLSCICVGRGRAAGVDYIDLQIAGTNTTGAAVDVILRRAGALAITGPVVLSAMAELLSGSKDGLSWLFGGQIHNSGAYVRGFSTPAYTFAAAARCSVTATITAPENQANYVGVTMRVAPGAAVNATVRVSALQFEAGAAPTAVQSAMSMYDLIEAGQPDLWYLHFDAVDDWLSTAAFDWGGDAVTLVLALRKRSDTGEGTLLHFGDFNSTPSFLVGGPGGSPSDKFFAFSRGTTRTPTISTSPTHSAPLAAVVAMQGRISTDTNILRINGVQVSSAAGDQGGSASYGVQQMFIGRRGGTTTPAPMDLYGLVAINRLVTAAELTAAEAWAFARCGAAA